MIETLEVLLREYELNSIDNNNSYTVRNRNAKKRDSPTPAQPVEPEPQSVRPESQSVEPEPQSVRPESQSVESEPQPPSPSLPLFVASKTVTECLSTMALAKGEHIGRGHTAYLTFATKIK